MEAQGKDFTYELENMYVSTLLANALLDARPGFAADQREARTFAGH